MNPSKPFTLYPTSLFKYEDCPQSFLWGRGWGKIDLGQGPGKKKEIPIRKTEHHAVLGTAIQSAIERFYNDELWNLLSPADLKVRLLELGQKALDLELARRYIDWNKAPPRDEMAQLVKNGILGYLRTLKEHKLLGPYAKAEVELLSYIDKDNPVGGRADVIIRRDDTGVLVLDGKNGKRYKDPKNKTRLMMYIEPDQLRYYAMLYYLAYHKMPDRLAFVPYRFPYGDPVLDVNGVEVPGAVEPGIEFVPFTKDDLKGLAHRAVEARKGMEAERFEARPSPSQCKMCDYESVCPERQTQIAGNRRGPRAGTDLMAGSTGFVTLTLGGSPVSIPTTKG